MTDDELYSSYLSGDTTAYDQLMIRHGDSLVFYLNGYLHDWQDAEDLMIEAFARIMAKRPSIRGASFKAYLFKTGRNLALRFRDRKQRISFFSMDGSEMDTVGSIMAADAGVSADNRPASDILADKERKLALMRCLDRIEPELREALWLIYFDEMSYDQAASVMGVKPKRIDRLLVRGKQQMRNELEKEGITNAYD